MFDFESYAQNKNLTHKKDQKDTIRGHPAMQIQENA